MAFANISIAGKSGGTISNSDGRFQINYDGIKESDSLMFSYMGYQTLAIAIMDFDDKQDISLNPTIINLQDVPIYSRSLTAEEIIDRVKTRFKKNHPLPPQKQRVFIHNFVRTPYPKSNRLQLVKSDFPSFDQNTFDDLYSRIPNEFIDYNDAIIDLYSYDGKHKLSPVQAVSLQEGSQKELFKVVESRLEEFIDDFYTTVKDEKTYYKIKSGIFGTKIGKDTPEDFDPEESRSDSLHYTISAGSVKYSLLENLKEYSRSDGEHLEFISKPARYTYSNEGITWYNGEPVFQLSFKPKGNGLFNGQIYVSASSFAILQMEFAYAKGKRGDHIQIFGFGYSMDFVKARVIYEKVGDVYLIKYISGEQIESTSLKRKFSVLKKQKRFLFDKELNEMKFRTDIKLKINSRFEVLVLDRSSLSSEQFENHKQERFIRFKKEFSNSPDIWQNQTVIVPDQEISDYRRKEN